MRTVRLVVPLLLAVATLVPTAASARGRTVVHNCTGKGVAHPARYVLACADGNAALSGMHWRDWGAARTTAPGRLTLNDCTPNCAQGHFHTYPVNVAAGRRSRGRGAMYRLLVVRYTGRRPHGARAVLRIRLGKIGPTSGG